MVTGPVSMPFIGRSVRLRAKADQRSVIGCGRETSPQMIGDERIAGTNAFLLKAELAKGEAEHGH